MPATSGSIAAGFEQPVLAQALQHAARGGIGLLHEARRFGGRDRAVAVEAVEDQQPVGSEPPASPGFLLPDEADEIEIGRAARQLQHHVGLGGTRVGGRRAAPTDLLAVDRIDAPGDEFDQAGAFEGVGEARIARGGRSDEEVVEPDSVRESAGAGDFEPVWMPDDEDPAADGVIAVGERVGDGLAEGAGIVIRHADAEHAVPDLAFLAACPEARVKVVDDLQQGALEVLVDQHFAAVEHLETGSVRGHVRGQGLGAAEQEQAQSGWNRGSIGRAALGGAEREGHLDVGQRRDRVGFGGGAGAVAVELGGIESIPRGCGDRQFKQIEPAEGGEARLHFMERVGHAGRFAVAAEPASGEAPVGSGDGDAGWRYFDGDDAGAVNLDAFDPDGDRRLGLVGDQRAHQVGGATAAGMGAGHLPIVFDSEQQPGDFAGVTVGEANDRLDKVLVSHRPAGLAFELDRERFAAVNECLYLIRCHQSRRCRTRLTACPIFLDMFKEDMDLFIILSIRSFTWSRRSAETARPGSP